MNYSVAWGAICDLYIVYAKGIKEEINTQEMNLMIYLEGFYSLLKPVTLEDGHFQFLQMLEKVTPMVC